MTGEVLLSLRGVGKAYGAVRALSAVDLDVYRGEVLALVGDNGAGKSTLIKVVSGRIQPGGGEIRLEGRKVAFRSPREAKAAGIETVYQDLALFEHATVTANLFAGRERTLGAPLPILDEAGMRRFARETLDRLRIHVPNVDAEIRHLSGGQRQSIAIGRAIAFGTKLVIMDEPTAALGAVESAKVLELIRESKRQGLTIILISHNLQHVYSVADRLAVLRHGEMAGVVEPRTTTGEAVVRMMVGADVAAVDLPRE